MQFRDLKVGDTFDFIDPHSIYNSFYYRCTKISTRRYEWTDKLGTWHGEVGTIKVPVYHVNESRPGWYWWS